MPDPIEPIDPPWLDNASDDEKTLQEVLSEPEPVDPPWARVQNRRALSGRIDPPWAEEMRDDVVPPEPIEPDWARVEEQTVRAVFADPPWMNDPQPSRGPGRLPGLIDPPWVPDEVSEALETVERETLKPFEPDWARTPSASGEGAARPQPIDPDWVDDPPHRTRGKPSPIDPGWEPSTRSARPPPVEPDWANPPSPGLDDDELFDPGWEATIARGESVPDPFEPSWAVETEEEVTQRQSDPFETSAEDVAEPAPIRDGRVWRGAKRLRELATTDLNPFGRERRQAARRKAEREDLIRNAMRIRAETRAALGEENVDRLYEALMGSPPPKSEDN